MKWEYKIIAAHAAALSEDQLNELGAEGWELIGFNPGTPLIFKRAQFLTNPLADDEDFFIPHRAVPPKMR